MNYSRRPKKVMNLLKEPFSRAYRATSPVFQPLWVKLSSKKSRNVALACHGAPVKGTLPPPSPACGNRGFEAANRLARQSEQSGERSVSLFLIPVLGRTHVKMGRLSRYHHVIDGLLVIIWALLLLFYQVSSAFHPEYIVLPPSAGVIPFHDRSSFRPAT